MSHNTYNCKCDKCKYQKKSCTTSISYCNQIVLKSHRVTSCKCLPCERKPGLSVTVNNPCSGAIIRQKTCPVKKTQIQNYNKVWIVKQVHIYTQN